MHTDPYIVKTLLLQQLTFNMIHEHPILHSCKNTLHDLQFTYTACLVQTLPPSQIHTRF